MGGEYVGGGNGRETEGECGGWGNGREIEEECREIGGIVCPEIS